MRKLGTLILVLLLFASCQMDDFDTSLTNNQGQSDIAFQDNFGGITSANFIGKVQDSNGNSLSGVQITLGASATTTDHNGVFVLNNAEVYEKFAYLKASKDGYINGSRAVVPVPNGTNDIQITLLPKTVVGSVNSGATSSVSLGDSKVSFSGAFIDANGNPYNGQVDVVMHYLQPNQQSTFEQMPGMLLAQNSTNDAQTLETYGMLLVNLYSPSGEALNIAENSPATLEFPVDTSQTSSAPEIIPLWFFDEAVGYWKEEGQAVKTGSKYIGDVNHFSWWNCDLPGDMINFCFELDIENYDGANFYFKIIRSNNDQTIYTGFTNDIGQECGMIPLNEEVEIQIFDLVCSDQIIHSQVLGPYTTDTSITISIPELPSASMIVNFIGQALNCDGDIVTNGYLIIQGDSPSQLYSITDGIINFAYQYCAQGNYEVTVLDLDTNFASDSISINLNNDLIELDTISVCDNPLGGIYVGDVILRTQNDINSFGLFGYTEVQGSLRIGDYYVTQNSDINDITPLSSLTSITNLLAIQSNPQLVSLNGLQNLNSDINQLWVLNNSQLVNLDGLSVVNTDIYEIRIVNNNSLLSLTSFPNLQSATRVEFQDNILLNDISGIETIASLELLYIDGNDSLTSLNSFSNLTSLEGCNIRRSNLISNLEGLENIASLQYLRIEQNDVLNSISALSNLNSIESSIVIRNCPSLTSLSGLEGCTSLVQNLEINNNNSLIDVSALNSVNSIGGSLIIHSNPLIENIPNFYGLTSLDQLKITNNQSLINLNGLNDLSHVEFGVLINFNESLTSIESLNNLNSINGILYIGSNNSLSSLSGLESLALLTNAYIGVLYSDTSMSVPNNNLSDFCALTNLFTNGTYGDVYIDNNAYNPTVQDIIDGNCSN
ncbi:MAG: hypothetical protein HRT68_03465 [Flavobacteriaceae bacterium]|nr:hypothetical protein [Flavobacteriaceae bacterium]